MVVIGAFARCRECCTTSGMSDLRTLASSVPRGIGSGSCRSFSGSSLLVRGRR